MRPELPRLLLARVTPQAVREFALARGWQRAPRQSTDFTILCRPEDELEQLLVPRDPGFADYPERIADLTAELARHEGRSPQQILADLLTAEADVLRFRVESSHTTDGNLPLEQAIDLLEGARRSLLAAACSVLDPVTHHRRMSRTEAEQLFRACKLQQTERGSFTIALACPLRAVPSDPADAHASPFTRRATTYLMRSTASLVEAIEQDNTAQLLEDPNWPVVISANLCDALLRMQPRDDHGALHIAASWAPALPPPPDIAAACSRVSLRQEHFVEIEGIYRELRPTGPLAPARYFGTVEELKGTLTADNRRRGRVTLLLADDGEILRVDADLDAELHARAVRAYDAPAQIEVEGVLHMGVRSHVLKNIRRFVLVEPPSSEPARSTPW